MMSRSTTASVTGRASAIRRMRRRRSRRPPQPPLLRHQRLRRACSISTPRPAWPPATSAASSAASTDPPRGMTARPSGSAILPIARWRDRTSPTLDRARLARLMADETARVRRPSHPRSAALHERAKGSLLEGVPMPWMVKWASPVPAVRRERVGRPLPVRRRPRLRRLLPRRHRRDGRPRPGADHRRRRAPDAPRHHPHAPDRGRAPGSARS